ncbi:MAG: hypothetical protein ACREIU_08075 [Planctomycetota bacterium]
MTRRRAVLLDFGNTLVGEISIPEAGDREGAPLLEAHLARGRTSWSNSAPRGSSATSDPTSGCSPGSRCAGSP